MLYGSSKEIRKEGETTSISRIESNRVNTHSSPTVLSGSVVMESKQTTEKERGKAAAAAAAVAQVLYKQLDKVNEMIIRE